MFSQVRIDTGKNPARSLCWRDDTLVDWVSGGDSWTLAGHFRSANRRWGYDRLDAATCDRTGRWAVVYERTGTAGILLRDGKIIREIHRSPYHADRFEYPVCLFECRGKVLLAHCPDHYARIEIDDSETGERLTTSASRREPDFFHSRLAVSPGGQRLLSAGWVWQPWDTVLWFDVEAALTNPETLDALNGPELSRNVFLTEEGSASWLDDDRLLIGGSSFQEDKDESATADRTQPGHQLKPNSLAVFDIGTRTYSTVVPLGQPAGAMMRLGKDHILALFKHPRLVSLQTGEAIYEWSEINSGEVVSSIIDDRPYPALALDPVHSRFAVGREDGIDVVNFDLSKLR